MENEEKKEVKMEPVIVRNRDIPLLANTMSMMQELKYIQERREWQIERMTSMTQRLTGMPGAKGANHGLDDLFARLSDIEEEMEDRLKEYAGNLKKVQRILNSIESVSMRAFVTMKYVMDAPDTEIRQELNMTRRGFDRARMCVEQASSMTEVKWMERYILAE